MNNHTDHQHTKFISINPNANTNKLRVDTANYIETKYGADPDYKHIIDGTITAWYEENKLHPELSGFGRLVNPIEKLNRYLQILQKLPHQRIRNERIGDDRIYWGTYIELLAIANLKNINIRFIMANIHPTDNHPIINIPDPELINPSYTTYIYYNLVLSCQLPVVILQSN